MTTKSIKKTSILAILFFLPVLFLLFLYPSQHNYSTLDIIAKNINEVSAFTDEDGGEVLLGSNLTVLGFFGCQTMDKATVALNLKELIYDKFKGFKRFQILIVVPQGSEAQVKLLKKELIKYDEVKYWRFAYGHNQDIIKLYNSLKAENNLDVNLSTDHVFIIDKDRNQRGRRDDRTERQVEKREAIFSLSSYDCIEVATIKNKMSEDLRILFTEYRQKRKGNFDSTSRRADDIKTDEASDD